MVDSAGKSVRNLAETLHSLLGHKAHLTSNWVKSVCDIIKTLPISEKPVVLQPTDIDTIDDHDSACTTISKIKDELATLTNHINQLNVKRRQILNQFLDLKGNIRVFCRIRPIAVGENIGQLRPVVVLDSNKVLLNVADNKSKSYEFDKVFHPGSSQDEVFSEVEPIIKSVLDGYNACIFAYGQTGTGKTFTMEGSTDAPGIVPQAIKALFKQAGDSNHAFLISFSMLEIYMGNLKDLLVPKPTKATDPMPPCLSIQADPEGGTEIDNLVTIKVNDFNQALRLYRLGCRFRSTASTNSNLTSSRSHCMIRIAITCFDAPERRRETNKIWLVDLGGSERMLKTKAWGKRLDEGKAINLSLSALGDVINALQRKKHHIPYRNSKLTQVLKDSLGDDSKTIMLVHVSPKEEDLCETICSLNFATRAKSIHLGNEDTVDVRKQKEVAMSDLQQKMKKIEDERLHVRSDIQKLNKKLENQTGTNSTSGEQLQTDHSSTEERPTKNGIGNISAASLSKLPRFMRPTICSKRKMGTTYQTTEGGDDPVLVRRRRPSTRQAESVSFPVKNHSEYNSDCSISRSSCLARLNMKNSGDNMTEYSQHMSETDVNIIGLQEGVPRSSNHQKAGISHVQKNSSRHMNKINHIKFSKVDNWLQKNEPPPVNVYTQRTKRVLAAPITEKRHKRNVQRKAENFCDEKEHGCEFTMQKVVNHDQINNLVSTAGVGTPISEVVIEKPLRTLKDLFNEDSRSDVISPWGKTLIQTEDSVDGSLARDDEFSTFSPPHGSCSTLDDYKDDDDDVNTMSIAQELEGRTQCPECFVPENCGCCECYPSELYTSFICSKRDAGVSISMLELESSCRQAATKSNTEDGERQDLNVPFQPFAKETKHGLLQLRAKRALFMKSENQDDFAVQFNKTNEKIQTTGLWHVVKQKIEILRASALLGIGFYSLGFEHDFFFGLML